MSESIGNKLQLYFTIHKCLRVTVQVPCSASSLFSPLTVAFPNPQSVLNTEEKKAMYEVQRASEGEMHVHALALYHETENVKMNVLLSFLIEDHPPNAWILL